MSHESFKRTSRRIVIELAVVIALVSYNITLPKTDSTSQAWKFTLTHPTILLHILVGSIVVIEAFVLLVRSIKSHDRIWTVLSALGLALVLFAWASGETYVATRKNSALTNMGNSAAGALITYGFAWYWGHRKSKTLKKVPPNDSPVTPKALADTK